VLSTIMAGLDPIHQREISPRRLHDLSPIATSGAKTAKQALPIFSDRDDAMVYERYSELSLPSASGGTGTELVSARISRTCAPGAAAGFSGRGNAGPDLANVAAALPPAGFLSCASVEKEPPDQNPVIAEHARDGTNGERHDQPDSERRSLVA
jgi:hypothetical protein